MYDDGAESELTHMHLTSPSIIACRPRRLAIWASQRSLRFGVGLAPQPNHAMPARTCILSASWLLG